MLKPIVFIPSKFSDPILEGCLCGACNGQGAEGCDCGAKNGGGGDPPIKVTNEE